MAIHKDILSTAYKLLGERIQYRREERGISQIKLADRLGITLKEMQNIEEGLGDYTVSTLLTICQELDMFFFFEEKENKTELAEYMRERWRREGDQN